MPRGMFDLSPRGWGRVILWTVLGTLLCVGVSLYVDSFNFPQMDEAQLTRALLVDIFLPICLAVPMLLFLTIKLRELAIAHEELARYASTDALTSVLNRAAFIARVEAHLGRGGGAAGPRGALLLVDADRFKAINDNFGHDQGDEALRIIAAAIARMVRSEDAVGRIGGEEFAVLLPGADARQAEQVADRIRVAIARADFAPAGTRRELSVSVGGAVFDRRLPFIELFRVADQQLYTAKRNGRNRICVTRVDDDVALPPAAAA